MSMMRPDPIPSRVLESIDAHGALDRWHAIDEMVLSASVGGASLSVKHQGRAIRGLQAHVSPRRQHVVFVPYPEPDMRGVFDEGAVRIESDRGEVIADRSDARSAFRGFRHQLWWDKLDVLYFCGYALWIYLTIPFVARDGTCRDAENVGLHLMRDGLASLDPRHVRLDDLVVEVIRGSGPHRRRSDAGGAALAYER
jgi:hypothetical protein